MCGICGFTEAGEGSRSVLESMCDVMAHRGPDGEGFYVADGIALGHRRLSLIDLEAGNQPMVRSTGDREARITSPSYRKDGAPCGTEEQMLATGDYAIVFNGEIYNYREISDQLVEEGWKLQTKSDTEALLVGYIAWGEEVLQKVRGMFAFAIWDLAKRELFCARDFFGIKPFYYTMQGTQFVFASEIKCILEHPAYERELNMEALQQYLCFQFSALDETFFKGIFKLPPAHCMRVKSDGSMQTRRYWKPEFEADDARSRQQTVDEIDAEMHVSVRYHNVADVEVGSFLSSGIDSSYMAACLAEENPDIKTFTVGFAEYGSQKGERDEISWAKELAEELGVENYSHHIGEEEYWESLPLVQWHMDEPSADPSAVALYFVDKLAAEQVKAVLSGEGADEFFGGYKIYQAPLDSGKLDWCPKPLLRGASKLLRKLGVRGANYLERASETVSEWYYTNANGVAFTPEERSRVLKGSQGARMPQAVTSAAYAEASAYDQVTQMQYVDQFFWLVGDILLKTDKMSMAHSLESRVPFLDKGVFDVARTIPTPLRVTEQETKVTLREAAERAIPEDWARKEKLGFPVPIVKWLREDRYYDQVKEWFTGPEAEQFFDTDELLRILDEHKAGADRSRKIWIVWMFLMWYRIYFVDRRKPSVG